MEKNSLNLKRSFISGLGTNWINFRHWVFFGSKNVFKSFRFSIPSYFQALRYSVVVSSFSRSAQERQPLLRNLLEYFFPRAPHLILIFCFHSVHIEHYLATNTISPPRYQRYVIFPVDIRSKLIPSTSAQKIMFTSRQFSLCVHLRLWYLFWINPSRHLLIQR